MVLLLAVSLLTAGAPVAGQPQQTFWTLVVNDVPKGDVIAVLDGANTWLPVSALEEAGLRRFAGERRTLFNGVHVRLESLAPDITYRRDLSELSIRIIAAPRFFDTNVVVLQRDRPDGISYASTTAVFTNYSVTWDQRAGTSGYGESGISLFGNTSIGSGYSASESGGFIRGLSTMTVDKPSHRLRLELGDTVAQLTPLGSAPIVAGVSFGRDYSLDPYYYHYPTPFIRGTATAPSDVEIYVNGVLVRRVDIGPGPYQFDRLPVNTGLGDVQVIVRDPFGRQQTMNMSLYQPSGVLRSGEHDFQFIAGTLRDDSNGKPTYGEMEGIGFERVGVTNWLTLGYSAEGSHRVVSGGPTLSMKLAKFGELELNGSLSQTRDKTKGVAGYGTYNFVAPLLNVSITAQYYGNGFSNLGTAPGAFSTPEFYQATAGVPLWSFGSLAYTWDQRRSPASNFGYTLPDGTSDPEKIRSRDNTLRFTWQLFSGAQLTAAETITNTRGENVLTGFVGFNITAGRHGTTASVTHAKDRDTESNRFDINRSLPLGPGIGFRVSGSDVDGGAAGGEFDLNTRFNRLRVNYDSASGGSQQTGSVTLSGGISATRTGLYFTRPLDASAAIVEVEGLKGVHVLVDNTPVGRTNGGGTLMINELLPYLANRISYHQEDIPFDYSVPVLSQLAAPPFRGVAYVKFKTARIQARTGTVVLTVAGARVVPSYGTIVVQLEDRSVESPLNEGGDFFLDLPNGRYTGTVTFKGKSCNVEFDATTVTEMIQNVGTLTCAL